MSNVTSIMLLPRAPTHVQAVAHRAEDAASLRFTSVSRSRNVMRQPPKQR